MIFTVPPTFTNRPTNVYAHEKHDVTLSCQAAGNPPPKTSWLKNGKPLIPDDYFQLVESKNLKILGLLLSDNGYYQCVAENTVGSIQATIQLQVLEQGRYSLNVTINRFNPLPHRDAFQRFCKQSRPRSGSSCKRCLI